MNVGVLIGKGKLKKADDIGPQDRMGHSAGADIEGRDHYIRPGGIQGFFGSILAGPGHNVQTRVQPFGQQDEEDIVGVGTKGCD